MSAVTIKVPCSTVSGHDLRKSQVSDSLYLTMAARGCRKLFSASQSFAVGQFLQETIGLNLKSGGSRLLTIGEVARL